ncbi:MAG: hypothetical protein LUG66_05050 [Clostridiales bacterium]|nr:hypothetical protein [Clostridiales bacterium]
MRFVICGIWRRSRSPKVVRLLGKEEQHRSEVLLSKQSCGSKRAEVAATKGELSCEYK